MDSLKRHVMAEQLVKWYRGSHRNLPWRRTRDPYRIWVSEIMLQQTRVETVIPYYETFLRRFPNIETLAEAPEEELIKIWEGLGYYSRARNMQTAARMIQQQYGGQMPDTLEDIRKLKGIGPYTAGAILSIAFGKPVPAVDGNVLRVMSRFFLLYDDIAKPATRKKVEQMLEDIIPQDAAGDFNQALMELGALVCTPRTAKCDRCPIASHCDAYREKVVHLLPVKTKAKKPRYEERAVFIIEGTGGREGQIFLQQRPAEGLLAKMWELPNELLSFEAQEQFGLTERYLMDVEHVFSHIKWQMKVYVCKDVEAKELLGWESLDNIGFTRSEKDLSAVKETVATYEAEDQASATAQGEQLSDHAVGAGAGHGAETGEGPSVRWVSQDNWRELALPNVFLRILQQYFAEHGQGIRK